MEVVLQKEEATGFSTSGDEKIGCLYKDEADGSHNVAQRSSSCMKSINTIKS